ncbi:hypothetical protein ACJX0J_030501, partial [Zea mays]
ISIMLSTQIELKLDTRKAIIKMLYHQWIFHVILKILVPTTHLDLDSDFTLHRGAAATQYNGRPDFQYTKESYPHHFLNYKGKLNHNFIIANGMVIKYIFTDKIV